MNHAGHAPANQYRPDVATPVMSALVATLYYIPIPSKKKYTVIHLLTSFLPSQAAVLVRRQEAGLC